MFSRLEESLIKKGYLVDCFASKEEAVSYLDKEIDGTSVGIGGSQTVSEMGLYEKLCLHNEVYWHDRKPETLTLLETRKKACACQVYISSVNAISEDGEIVNIDHTGNRVAGTSFGPDRVYFVIGKNKVAKDLEGAIFRARNVAAPKNARRLKRNTPCAKNADRCYDCKSPERICRNLSVFLTKPAAIEYHVILIDEELGY